MTLTQNLTRMGSSVTMDLTLMLRQNNMQVILLVLTESNGLTSV
jgi:hypothetical protein